MWLLHNCYMTALKGAVFSPCCPMRTAETAGGIVEPLDVHGSFAQKTTTWTFGELPRVEPDHCSLLPWCWRTWPCESSRCRPNYFGHVCPMHWHGTRRPQIGLSEPQTSETQLVETQKKPCCCSSLWLDNRQYCINLSQNGYGKTLYY